jgi:hypothetical protein
VNALAPLVVPVLADARAPRDPAEAAPRATALERELDRAAAADEFSGTVIVAKHGVPIFERAYGQSRR